MIRWDCPLVPVSENRKATQIQVCRKAVSSSVIIGMFYLMDRHKLGYGNVNKQRIAPVVGKHLLGWLSDSRRSMGRPGAQLILRVSCYCKDSAVPPGSVLLSCKAATPGTRWLWQVTLLGAAAAVLPRSTEWHPFGGKPQLIGAHWDLTPSEQVPRLETLPFKSPLLLSSGLGTGVSMLMQTKWLH